MYKVPLLWALGWVVGGKQPDLLQFWRDQFSYLNLQQIGWAEGSCHHTKASIAIT